MAKQAKYNDIAKILDILGGLIVLIGAILSLAGAAYFGPAGFGVVNWIVGAIIGIILGIIVILAAIRPNDPIPWNGVVVLILGIIVLIIASLIGGILIIIAGILLLV